MKVPILILAICMLLLGCQVNPDLKEKPEICKPPMIEVAGQCCNDANNNSICDDLEKETVKLSGAVIAEIQQKKTETKFINLTELESGINLTYYPVKKFSFTTPYRHNLTEVEKTFDIRTSDRFVIYKMKYNHNYLDTEKNFSDFVTALHDLASKNNNIWARDTIDYKKRSDSDWVGATYFYEPYLEKTNIGGKQAFYEQQILIFNKNDQILSEIDFEMRLILWCTPEFVIRMYPSDRFRFYYQFGNTVKGTVDYIKKISPPERKIMEAEAIKIMKVCNGQAEPYKMKPNEILLDEYGEFTPNKLEISKGGTIILNNQMKWTEGVLLIFLDEKEGYSFLSDMIPRDTSLEIQVNRTGNYRVFSEVLDGKLDLTVR